MGPNPRIGVRDQRGPGCEWLGLGPDTCTAIRVSVLVIIRKIAKG